MAFFARATAGARFLSYHIQDIADNWGVTLGFDATEQDILDNAKESEFLEKKDEYYRYLP